MSEKILVIDGEDGVLGRIARFAAKQALLGKEIKIVNCNKLLVIGARENVLAEYRIARARGGSSLNGPHFPKEPYRVMKRTIRGMLSHRQGRGADALKRVLCYNDVPAEFEKSEKIMMKKKYYFFPILKKLSPENS